MTKDDSMKRYRRRVDVLAMLIAMSLSACSPGEPGTRSPLDTTYRVDGRAYELAGGKSRIETAPGSDTMITTSVYGPFATGDLNGDGVEDTGVILVQDRGGGEAFYYAAAALKHGGRYEGTHATLLGDGIVPVGIDIEDSVMEVTYRDRPAEDSMASVVSVEKSVRLVLKNDRLEVLPVMDSGGI